LKEESVSKEESVLVVESWIVENVAVESEIVACKHSPSIMNVRIVYEREETYCYHELEEETARRAANEHAPL
jgi:hypothetical protein